MRPLSRSTRNPRRHRTAAAAAAAHRGNTKHEQYQGPNWPFSLADGTVPQDVPRLCGLAAVPEMQISTAYGPDGDIMDAVLEEAQAANAQFASFFWSFRFLFSLFRQLVNFRILLF